MGGFIRARIIEVKFVHALQIENNRCTIIPVSGKSLVELDVIRNGINPNISVSNEKAGQIWNIDVSIDVKNRSGIEFISFNKFLLLLTNPLGEHMVLGSTSFPLRAEKSPLLSSTAEGKMGETIRFTGKQPFYPLYHI